MTTDRQDRIRNTIGYLRRCQEARQAGYPVYLTTDPTWLVDTAINRRSGWPESPDSFASAAPVDGRYPKRASGDWERHVIQLASRINTPRLRVYESELGEWAAYLKRHLPKRFANHYEEN